VTARRAPSAGQLAPRPADAGTIVLRAEGLAAGYDGVPALLDVTFVLRPGERVGLIGPNGGGKTTLFRAILGELDPVAGSVRASVPTAYVPQIQRSRLDYPVTALDVAVMGTLPRLPWWRRPGRGERARAHRELDAVGLAGLADASFGSLSGGQQQRVLIARALVQDARLLLLDEPFTGVDQASTDRLLELFERLAADGRTLLIATHDIDQTHAWDLVLCLNHRQVAFGPPEPTLSEDVLRATFPGAIVVHQHQGHERAGEEEPP
jgi:ABC-type Mn2+/Zn2+ transport system ATPase subunit